MLRFSLSCLLVTLFGHILLGAPQKSRGMPQYYEAFAEKEDNDRITHAKLRNGLSLVVEEQAILPLACLISYVKTDLLAGRQAAAASFHRFILETSSDIPFELGKLGGSFSVQVREDHVALVSVVPSEEISEALEIHARALRLESLSSEQLENGLQLFRKLNGRPPADLHEFDRYRLWSIVHPASGGDHSVLEQGGSPGVEEEVRIEDLRDYHRDFFRPDRMIVSVSGAVFRENVLRKSVELFASLKAGQAKRGSKPEDEDFTAVESVSFQYQSLRESRSGVSVRLGVRVPSTRHKDFFPILVLSTIIGKGRGSLLSRYVGDRELASHWALDLTPLRSGGLLDIELRVPPDKIDSAEVELLSILRVLGEVSPAAADLDRARAILVREHYQRLETLEGRASERAGWEAKSGYRELEAVPGRIQAVTAGQVREAAARYFRESNLSLLEFLPENVETRDFTGESFLETVRLLVPARASMIREEIESLNSLQNEETFRIPEFTPRFVHNDLRKTSVLRGPDVYLQERHVVPVVHVGFFLAGGRLDEDSSNAGITEVMLESILSGVPLQEGGLAWLDFEKMGGIVEVVNEPDFFGFQVSVLSQHLDVAVRSLRKWLVPQGLADREFALCRDRVRAQMFYFRDEPEHAVRSEIRERLFPRHPYALDRRGSEASLSSLDVLSVWAWTRKQLDLFHPVIVIHGDVAGTSFLPSLITTLSNSKFRNKDKVPRVLEKDAPEAAWAGSPGYVEVGFQSPVLGSRDAWVVTVLQHVVELMQEKSVAEERLWQRDFGKVSFLSRIHQNAGGLFFTTRLTTDDEEKAVSGIREGLSRFSTTIIRREDFLGALVGAITTFYRNQQDGHGSIRQLARDFIAGEKTEFRREFLTTIKGLQLDEVRLLGTRLFKISALEIPSEGKTP